MENNEILDYLDDLTELEEQINDVLIYVRDLIADVAQRANQLDLFDNEGDE